MSTKTETSLSINIYPPQLIISSSEFSNITIPITFPIIKSTTPNEIYEHLSSSTEHKSLLSKYENSIKTALESKDYCLFI